MDRDQIKPFVESMSAAEKGLLLLAAVNSFSGTWEKDGYGGSNDLMEWESANLLSHVRICGHDSKDLAYVYMRDTKSYGETVTMSSMADAIIAAYLFVYGEKKD